MSKTAVLLMAYGSPDNLKDMREYLLDIRNGRPTPPELVEEIRQRYEQIGGHSPLLDITRAQAAALEAELNRRSDHSGETFRTYVGMRHWQPRIAQAVAQIREDGIHRILGLVMAPHQSSMSSGAYYRKLEEAVAQQGGDIEILRLDSWYDAPGLIAALAERAQSAMQKFKNEPYVIFSAHSLPLRILKDGDPYNFQLHETARMVAYALGLIPERWTFRYQSAGQSSEPWLGPNVESAIHELADAGEKNILVVPVGFMCDHVEILYDLDIAAQKIAAQHGVRLMRSESLNTSPTFIAGLADMVWSHAYSLYRD